jgi:hypothetical protein
MSRLFDEPPVALSLADFIVARYTYDVLNTIGGEITRASALIAFQKRGNVDVGGFRVSFNPNVEAHPMSRKACSRLMDV